MHGSSVAPGDPCACISSRERLDEAEFLYRNTQPEPGVAQSQHRRLISAREGRSPARCRVKGFGLVSHSSQLLTGGRVICD